MAETAAQRQAHQKYRSGQKNLSTVASARPASSLTDV